MMYSVYDYTRRAYDYYDAPASHFARLYAKWLGRESSVPALR